MSAFTGQSRAQPGTPGIALSSGQISAAVEASGMVPETPSPSHAGSEQQVSPLERARKLAGGGSFFEARVAFREALQEKPGHLETLLAFAEFLQGFDRHQEALACLEQARQSMPHSVPLLIATGRSLLALGQAEQAFQPLHQALELAPKEAELLELLGRTLRALKQTRLAAALFRQALVLEPKNPSALTALAALLCSLNEQDEAEQLFREALALDPNSIDARLGLGNVALARERPMEALAHYESAEELSAQDPGIRYNQALALLTAGHFAEGWKRFEARLLRDKTWAEVAGKAWRGQPASREGQSLLLLAEQGLGDALQFARFIPRVAALGYRVSLLVHGCQKRLFEGQCGLNAVYSYGEQLPDFDEYCPLLSLAYLLGCDVETRFAPEPYLKPGSELAPALAETLELLPHPRIGLVWAGNPTHQNDHNRSLPLQELLTALPERNGAYVGLQKELRRGDAELLEADKRIQNLGEKLTDFADTAALLSRLDLLVSVDSSVAHLAGAMGVPVLLLLPFAPDWRWQLGRSDSPWYPKTALLRQTSPGNWKAPLEELKDLKL